VHAASRGIPRLINAICDSALLGAYAQDKHQVDAATTRRAAREVLGRPAPRSLRPWIWAAAVCAVLVVAGVGARLSEERLGLRAIGMALNRQKAPPVGAPPAAASHAAAVLQSAPAADAVEINPAPSLRISLGELLSDPSVRADRTSAFRSLYAQWGIHFPERTSTVGCDRGQAQGLRCLYRNGTWAKLRRMDLPAIIELATPSWERRYATVVALDDDTATLDLGGRRHTFSLSEVDRYWEGPFIVLWKSPALSSLSVKPGTRSKDVEWVRRRLSDLDGTPMAAADRAVFDDELRARVITFQRSRSLEPDGVVGEETLAHLSLTPRDPSIPRLSHAGS
jgi:general secretion pathway protein A